MIKGGGLVVGSGLEIGAGLERGAVKCYGEGCVGSGTARQGCGL